VRLRTEVRFVGEFLAAEREELEEHDEGGSAPAATTSGEA
jgi:hypothetical protein